MGKMGGLSFHLFNFCFQAGHGGGLSGGRRGVKEGRSRNRISASGRGRRLRRSRKQDIRERENNFPSNLGMSSSVWVGDRCEYVMFAGFSSPLFCFPLFPLGESFFFLCRKKMQN